MNRNQGKKKKLNLKRLILVLLILALSAVLVVNILYTNFLNKGVKNIYILNNNILSDVEIIRQANLEKYPPFIFINTKKIEKNLKKNELISSVKITKNIDFSITIEITEKTPVFYDGLNNKIVLDDSTKLDNENIYNLPILINNVPVDTYQNLAKKFTQIDKSIREKISEIKYYPNDVDDERFILTMKDGNYVYITLTKIKNINNYDSILPSLENKKGILYLDSGKYFEILDNNQNQNEI